MTVVSIALPEIYMYITKSENYQHLLHIVHFIKFYIKPTARHNTLFGSPCRERNFLLAISDLDLVLHCLLRLLPNHFLTCSTLMEPDSASASQTVADGYGWCRLDWYQLSIRWTARLDRGGLRFTPGTEKWDGLMDFCSFSSSRDKLLSTRSITWEKKRNGQWRVNRKKYHPKV